MLERPHDEARDGLIAIALAASLWALGAVVASDLFDSGVSPYELTLARAAVAAAGLLVLERLRRDQAPRTPLPSGRLLAFGMCITLVTAAYYVAIDRLSVAVAIVIQYAAPVLVVGWLAITGQRKPSPRLVIASLAAFAGVALISELPTEGIGDVDALGLAAAVASAIFFAAYAILSESAGQAYGPPGAMLRAFLISTIFWLCVQAFRGWPDELLAAENVVRVVFVGVAGTLLPFMFFVWGVARVRPERAAIAATLEPVLAALAAWLWLDESLSLVQLAGGAIVILAVLSLQITRPSADPVAL